MLADLKIDIVERKEGRNLVCAALEPISRAKTRKFERGMAQTLLHL